MADTIKFTCTKETRLLFSSITEKSAPRTVTNATPKFSGVFGLSAEDFNLMLPLMVQSITSEVGSFSGNPDDYYLACMSGQMAASRVLATANLNSAGKTPDEAMKIMEKAEKRAAVYREYAGILSASSQFDVELGQLVGGAIKDIVEPHARAQAGKDLFYPGAYVVPAIGLKGFRRKTLDAKDGVTAYLQNVLFLRKGAKVDTGGGGASNSDVFSTFKNYSDYDPTAMAPSAGAADFAAFTGGATAAAPPPPPVTAAAPPPPPPPPVVVDPMAAAKADGWAPHPNAAGYHYKGQEVKADADVAGMYAGPAIPPPPPVAGFGGLAAGAPAL